MQIIYLGVDDSNKKQRLMDTLLVHNVTCFGSGNHLLIIDENPERANHAFDPKVMKDHDVESTMKACRAKLLTFDERAFKAFMPYLAKVYVFKRRTANSLSYKSKTQPAEFTIFKSGVIKSTKDMLEIPLIHNLVRICYE